MSALPIPPALARPIRRDEYEKMVELGFFTDERVELLHGVIVRKAPHGPPHDSATERLNERLVLALAGRATVRIQSAFAASDGSEPEPDVAVVPKADYRSAHPTKAFLIIEVADGSLDIDCGLKARLYAESGVPEYWIVNNRDGIVEVHSDIVNGAYTQVLPYRRGSRVRVSAFPDVEISVDEILGAA